jgi:ankyrin repeat protein|uniref:Uncharacterized protein n=1 Tax=viral metagenome TaxID=1070528 RepID=A0A6C0IUE5_9ZZZZ
MELNEDFKSIIRNYLKAKKNSNNKQKFLGYLEKIILLFNKDIPITESNKEYIESIKKYTYENISYLINKSLSKSNKLANMGVFNLISEGNLECITDTDSTYNYEIYNNEGLTPLHRCINVGDTAILKELFKKGEKIDLVNKDGHTLLEYACLQQDPNVILFLINHGADMKKHLYFRNNIKLHLAINDIDTANIAKICLIDKESSDKIDLNFLFEYITPTTKIGLDDIEFKDFINNISNVVSKFPTDSQNSIITIWKEELSYQLKNQLGCPTNYLEIVLMNMVPFIEYDFNISNRNILTNEIIILIKHLILKNNYIFDIKFSKQLIDKIWEDYKNILSYDYLGLIINHIFSKVRQK